jgi:hypothetical protein
VVRHGFRNALVPLITISALQLGALLSGAVLTEQVFTIPGFDAIVDSVYNRDYSVVKASCWTTATITCFSISWRIWPMRWPIRGCGDEGPRLALARPTPGRFPAASP